jgi:hypothetical protein
MPVPWLEIPWAEMQAKTEPAAVRQEARVTKQVDHDLFVSAEAYTYDIRTQTMVFTRGVMATYGVTTVKADRLELYLGEDQQRGRATGNVVLEDPEAGLSAEDLEFSWKKGAQSGRARNVSIQVGRAMIRAREANLGQDLWTFLEVEATNCPEYYWIKSPRVIVRPGQTGKLEDPSIVLFGKKIVTLPDRNFNLNPRTQGVSLPSVNFRKGQGLGVSWEAGLLLNEYTNLYLSAGAFKGSYPGFGATITRTNVSATKASTIITPGSDMGERFRFGYFESIEIDNPAQELRFLRTPRQSMSLGTLWNQGVSGRNYETSVSKAVEGVLESGGIIGGRSVTRTDESGEKSTSLEGGLSYIGQARLQTIRERGNPFITRLVLAGSLELPSIQIAPKLSTLTRVDTSQFLGKNSFGWIRGSAGVVYDPIPQLRVGATAMTSKQFGTPDFQFDRLVSERGFTFRANLNLGPTQISYLTKYDTKLKWYDREYIVSQVAGCFEPFILYRQFPSDYRFGLRLRLDNFYELLERRTFKRTKPAAPASEPAHKMIISR